jgi:hypothetical protein
MNPYVKSGVFGLQRQFGEVIEELKCGLMPSSIVAPNFKNDGFNSKTYSDSDLIEDIIQHFYDTNTRMEKLSRIREYFYRFPDIAELSMDVANLVHDSFNSDAQLFLETRGEQNSEDEYLALFIRMRDYDDSVMERIKSIREEYALNLAELNGWFLLTTDYQPPRYE